MTRQTLIRTCPDCERAMWQKHPETCTGPPVQPLEREPECACDPGMRHERGCPIAYWPKDAA